MFEGLTPISEVNTKYQLDPYYEKIMDLMIEKNFDKVNGLLITLPLDEASTLLIMGLARLTSSNKNHLPYWSTYVSNVSKEIERREPNADIIMQGLI